MSKLELQPSETALWHALVNDAELSARQPLDSELESYLVHLLMRYNQKPEIANKIMALDYLEGQLAPTFQRETKLRDVADSCLLYSGLYPKQAERRRVQAGYYIDIGRSAYLQLAETVSAISAHLYQHLCHSFVKLMDVLSAIRSFSSRENLELLGLHDLWSEYGSRQAYQELIIHSDTLPGVAGNKDQKH